MRGIVLLINLYDKAALMVKQDKNSRPVEQNSNPLEQTFATLQSAQTATFDALEAVARKSPGLPRVVAAATERGSEAWVRSYFTAAQRLLETRRDAAERLVSINQVFISPRQRPEKAESLKAV